MKLTSFKFNIALALVLILTLTICTHSASALLESSSVVDIAKGEKLSFDGKLIDYNAIWDKYKPIEITSWWNLPLIGEKKLEGYIEQHDEICEYCSSTFTIKQYDEKALIEDIRFYTIKDDKRILQDIRSYKIYIQTGTEEEKVDDYSYVCSDSGKRTQNGSIIQSCRNEIVGNHIQYNPIWQEYKIGDVKPAGVYTIKLEGYKSPNRNVDWQIKLYGSWQEDWATWGSVSLTPTAYWSLDDKSGNVAFNNVNNGIYNLTLSNPQWNPNGKINGSLYINATYEQTANTTLHLKAFDNHISFNFWVNESSGVLSNPTGQMRAIIQTGNLNSNGDMALRFQTADGTGNLSVAIYDTGGPLKHTAGIMINTSLWNMITLTINRSILYLYQNAALTDTIALNDFNFTNADYNIMLFSDPTGSTRVSNITFDEFGIFNSTLSQDSITSLYNSGLGLNYSQIGSSAVTLNSPVNNYLSNSTIINFNCSAVTVGATLTNISLWDDSTGTWKLNKTNDVTGIGNSTLFSQNYFSDKSINWTCQACDSDNNCGFAANNRTLNIYTKFQTYNATSYETSTETFILNYSNINSAILVYNGSRYTTPVANGISSYSLGLTSTGNKSFYWEINGGAENSTTYYQNVLPIYLSICNSTNNISYYNYTFKDETTLANINASITTSTFNYYLDSLSNAKSYVYTNAIENATFAFCFSPTNRNINVKPNILYTSTGYISRLYNPGTYTSYDNITDNHILYLLDSSSGISVTFQVINSGLSAISGATISINKTLTNEQVGSTLTDSSGTASFYLNPNVQYTISVYKTGYNDYTTTLTPTGTSYTITLGASGTTTTNTTSEGVTTTITPSGEYLNNNTVYSFGFTISSTTYTLTQYGFNITNSSGSLLATKIGTNPTGSSLSENLDTGTNTKLILSAYYISEGLTSYVTPKYYTITNTGNTDASILQVATDFGNYMDTGLFGLKKGFSLNIIIFIIIFIVTGIFSYKFGLYSPAIVVGIIFGLTLFFDVGLNLITRTGNMVVSFPTIFIGIILVALIAKEATSY